MNTYNVRVTCPYGARFEVIANDEDEAFEIAQSMLENDEVFLDPWDEADWDIQED